VAICSVSPQHEAHFRDAVSATDAKARGAFRTTDPGIGITISTAAQSPDAWTEEGTQTLLDLLAVVPNGPLVMSSDFEGLVEMSTSVGEVATDGQTFTLHSLSRSSNDPALAAVMGALDAAARLAGGRLELGQADPGWRPNLDSAALAVTRRVYQRLFEKPPTVTAVHAWLETAVIGDKAPGLDMISFGPQIEAPHSPDERVSIPTVERFWQLLTGVVDELSAA